MTWFDCGDCNQEKIQNTWLNIQTFTRRENFIVLHSLCDNIVVIIVV